MKRMHLNMGLAAAALGLAVAVWVSREKPEQLLPLTPFTESELTSIAIRHPDAKAIRLDRQDGGWRLVEPVSAPTDPLEVNSLLGLAKLEIRRSLPIGEVELAELGLDPPKYTVTLNDLELGFGDTEPIEYRRYVKADSQVALVTDPPGTATDADYSDLVAKELLPAGAKIQRIDVPGLTVRLSDDGNGWLADGAADATSDQLQAFVSAWRNARAMWNAGMPKANAGDGDTVRIVLDGGTVELRVAAREPQLLIDRPDYGVRYTLSKADADELLRLPEPEATAAPTTAP